MVREDAAGAGVNITFTAVPGPPTVFGDVSIDNTGALSDRVIRRELAFTTESLPLNRVIRVSGGSGRWRSSLANVDAKPPKARATAVPV